VAGGRFTAGFSGAAILGLAERETTMTRANLEGCNAAERSGASNFGSIWRVPPDPKRRFTAHSTTLARAATTRYSRSVLECGAKHRFACKKRVISGTSPRPRRAISLEFEI
jgi:hypothetical protein